MEIPKDIKDEIWEYCRLNDITDLNAFMIRMLRQGYNTEKYGTTPFKIGQKEAEVIEKEVIKEVPVEIIKEIFVEKEIIKEVPIEVEKIVEVIKEVPIEIIKEVIVEKQVKGKTKTLEKEIIIEKIIEVPVEIIKEVVVEKEVFVGTNNDEKVKKLEQQVENLKIELELEKNRNFQPKPKEKVIDNRPQGRGLNNVITWVSKAERDGEDIYGE
jgi:hypothetical protein